MDFSIGELVESITFTAANPPVVLVSMRGSTVARTGVGAYSVTLSLVNQIDPVSRTVTPTVAAGGVPSLAVERPGGTDQVVAIGNTNLAGAPADSGDAITVQVFRTSVG